MTVVSSVEQYSNVFCLLACLFYGPAVIGAEEVLAKTELGNMGHLNYL